MVRTSEDRRAMKTPLTATVHPTRGKGKATELAVTLQIRNASGSTVEVLNPDMGRPSPSTNWPWSLQAYRASLLMSYGYLAVSVTDESGHPVVRKPLETWATPVLRPRLALAPGDSFDVVIPVGRLFPLSTGGKYRVSVEYGDGALKVRGEGSIDVPG
jgi:hypothetical protein